MPILPSSRKKERPSDTFPSRKKETMRIGDENLFEIGCRKWKDFPWSSIYYFRPLSPLTLNGFVFTTGVECPSVGSFNTISARARVHYTVRLTSNCTLGPGVLLLTAEEETLPNYTVVYGPNAERRIWSGKGKVQELYLRGKHAEYLRETIPKFNRVRKVEEDAT